MSISTLYTSLQCQSTAIWAINISPLDCQIDNDSLIYNSQSTPFVDLTQ